MVAPFMLAQGHPLYNVNDVFNAIFVHGNVLGDAMFYGSGAGKLPTASAVAADIVERLEARSFIDLPIFAAYEASVGGGIPIIRPLNYSLTLLVPCCIWFLLLCIRIP